jgi:putative ABC transport system ATP-binding protein
MPMAEIVTLRGIRRRFGDVVAVRGADLVAYPGELTVLIGRSGSGKTTLLAIAGGLERADEGSASVCGAELTGLSPSELDRFRRDRVGWVFQVPGLLPLLSASENVALPVRVAGAERRSAERAAASALAVVGLSGRADHRAYELSGGEQQRVALARALIKKPPLLLADEPTGQLDSETAAMVMDLLRKEARQGTAVIVATHDEAFAEYAHRVLLMDDGKVTEPTRQP